MYLLLKIESMLKPVYFMCVVLCVWLYDIIHCATLPYMHMYSCNPAFWYAWICPSMD